MQYYIYHWYGGKLPEETKLSNIMTDDGEMVLINTIEIDDIHEFAMQYKDIRLVAPLGGIPLWRIYITDKGWGQR